MGAIWGPPRAGASRDPNSAVWPRIDLKHDDGLADLLDKWLNKQVILTNQPPGSAKHKGRVTNCAAPTRKNPRFVVSFPDGSKKDVAQNHLRFPVNCLANPVLRHVLLGSIRPSSPLSALRTPGGHLLHRICQMIIDGWNDQISHRPTWEGLMVTPSLRPIWEDRTRENLSRRDIQPAPIDEDLQPAFVVCNQVEFPPFTGGIRVNMMPIRMGDVTSLPENLRAYQKLIDKCPIHASEKRQIGYVTVHESEVKQGQTQTRGGLHTERMGGINLSGENRSQLFWCIGFATSPDCCVGGLYIANSVDNSCEVFDFVVADGVMGPLGDLEHVRDLLGKSGTPMQSGSLVWMTDRTPHAALPQLESGRRQFFRLVAGPISHWFADHSTENPLVSLPDDVEVVKGDKFMMGQTRGEGESEKKGEKAESSSSSSSSSSAPAPGSTVRAAP